MKWKAADIKKTKYEKLGIPDAAQVGNYAYKDLSKVDSDAFTYRGKNSNCRISISITINIQDKSIIIVSYIQRKEHKQIY